MKPVSYMAIVLCVMLFLTGCSSGAVDEEVNESVQNKTAVQNKTELFTRNTKIEDVINAPSFDGFGRLLFPTDEYYYSGDTLEELGLTYYSHIDPDETVEIVNTLRERAADGQTIFYDIYTDEEKAADPAKEDTGLFFFKGVPARNSLSAMQAVPLPMWAPCRTASLMRWSFLKRATTPSLSFIAPAHRLPARTWQEPSASSLPMRTNWKWTPAATPYGAAQRERGWRRGLGLTVQKLLAAAICPVPVRSSCSTRD